MRQVYSGTEYNRKLRSEPKTLIKLTNGAGIHRGCDYNLRKGEPKRIDDPVPWNPFGCQAGGIYFVAGEEYVVEWLNYSPEIGKIERAFLVQIPEEDNVKVIEFDKKVKSSSIVICKELDFEAVVRSSRDIQRLKEEEEMRKEEEKRRKEEEKRRKQQERERAEKEFRDQEDAKNKAAFGLILDAAKRLSEQKAAQRAKIRPEIDDEEFKRRLEFVKNALNAHPETLSVACVNARFVNEAYEALQEYGSLDNIPISDRRLASFFSSYNRLSFEAVQQKSERTEFWWIYDCIMLRLRSFIRSSVGKTAATSALYFNKGDFDLMQKYRDDLILVGPFSSVELDCVLAENWPALLEPMSTNPERFFS